MMMIDVLMNQIVGCHCQHPCVLVATVVASTCSTLADADDGTTVPSLVHITNKEEIPWNRRLSLLQREANSFNVKSVFAFVVSNQKDCEICLRECSAMRMH